MSGDEGVAANRRLTALAGALLLVLLVLMGITVLDVRALLPQHLLLGFILIPPLALKSAATGYRFLRYYAGDPGYRRAGPPDLALRLLAPLVVLTTVAVFATGLELWYFGLRLGAGWVFLHKASFVAWSVVTTLHVLAHLGRTSAAVAEELARPAREPLRRRSLVVGSLVVGVVIALASLAYPTPVLVFGD